MTISDYILDKENNAITIYIAAMKPEDFFSYMLEDDFRKVQWYRDDMRFEKLGIIYKVQRFCHISRYYGWITMESSEDIEYLTGKYCRHLEKDSLLQFWIEGEEDW